MRYLILRHCIFILLLTKTNTMKHLVFFLLLLISYNSFSQGKTDEQILSELDSSFTGMVMISNRLNFKSVIAIGENVTINVGKEKYKGQLTAVTASHITVGEQSIPVETITKVKYRSKKRLSAATILTVTGPPALFGALALAFEYDLGSLGAGVMFVAGTYGLVGTLIGPTLFSKKEMDLSQGWTLHIIE